MPNMPPFIIESKSSGGGGCLSKAFKSFLQPQRAGPASGISHKLRITDYLGLGSRSYVKTLKREDPIDCWLSRLNHWLRLSHYTLELITFLVASMLSERTT